MGVRTPAPSNLRFWKEHLPLIKTIYWAPSQEDGWAVSQATRLSHSQCRADQWNAIFHVLAEHKVEKLLIDVFELLENGSDDGTVWKSLLGAMLEWFFKETEDFEWEVLSVEESGATRVMAVADGGMVISLSGLALRGRGKVMSLFRVWIGKWMMCLCREVLTSR